MTDHPGQPHVHRRKTLMNEPKQKCCPTCLRVMVIVGKHHECPKHGRPE